MSSLSATLMLRVVVLMERLLLILLRGRGLAGLALALHVEGAEANVPGPRVVP